MNCILKSWLSFARRRTCFIFAAALLLSITAAWPQGRGGDPAGQAYVRSNYTKFEYQIPMRDGMKLFTAVYVPKDTSVPYPIIMQRTPYSIGSYGSNTYPARLGPSELFTKEKFIFVYQDVRGRSMSEGIFVDVPPHKPHFTGPTDHDESTDSYDTIDWLVKNIPNNNGRVGTWGVSYPGFFSAYTSDQRASGAEGGVAAGADGGRGERGRRVSQRRVFPGGEFWLLHGLLSARAQADRSAAAARAVQFRDAGSV